MKCLRLVGHDPLIPDVLYALGARYQIALGQHAIVLAEVFGAAQESIDPIVSAGGGRLELQIKF